MFTPHNMSHVACHVSCVTCHLSHVTFFFFFFFFWTKWWSLLVEGLLSTEPTPSSFFLDYLGVPLLQIASNTIISKVHLHCVLLESVFTKKFCRVYLTNNCEFQYIQQTFHITFNRGSKYTRSR